VGAGSGPSPPKWDDWVFDEIFSRPNGWSIRDYWDRATLGLVSVNFELQPWRKLPETRLGQEKDRRLLTALIKSQAANDGVDLDQYDRVVAFIHPVPSNAGAVHTQGEPFGSPYDALLDSGGSIYFYQHEIGHVIGCEHSWGAVDGDYAEYADDYCVMGGSADQSHPISASIRFASIPLVPDFWISERRFSAAALYRYSRVFENSPSVIRLDTGRPTEIVLTGLCAANLFDPVLAVIQTKMGQITVEYRPNIGDDIGVDPAIVIHSIDRRSVGAGLRPVVYEGKIRMEWGGYFRTKEGDVLVTADNSAATSKRAKVRIFPIMSPDN
jgi:hypothetical protein